MQSGANAIQEKTIRLLLSIATMSVARSALGTNGTQVYNSQKMTHEVYRKVYAPGELFAWLYDPYFPESEWQSLWSIYAPAD